MNEPYEDDPTALLLQRIRPAAPRPELMQRLLAACPECPAAPAPSPARLTILRFFPHFAAAAAVFTVTGAAVWMCYPAPDGSEHTVSVTTPGNAPETPAPVENAAAPVVAAIPPGLLTPQMSNQKLLGVRDLGIARDAQSRPVRLMHATWLDDTTYSSGNGAPPVRESRVRDEIVPVVLTTY